MTMSGRNKEINVRGIGSGLWGPACGFILLAALVVWLLWPAGSVQEVREGAFLDVDPLGRAVYCRQASVAELIVLASDTDWRVRAAAFVALGRIGPVQRTPLRDTPIDKRETRLLHWMDQNRPELSAELCTVYAQPTHVRFSEVLVQRCLTCHAGPRPEPAHQPDRCAACHPTIHADWSGTAHANSLSHLRLPTVDTVTRQPGTYDFLDRKGLSCVACHEPRAQAVSQVQKDACVSAFTTSSCTTCHASTGAQWEVWTKAPHYRQAVWPPGSVELIEDVEPQSCTDCHMPDGGHLWGARRDIQLLRSGIAIRIQEDGGSAVSLVLQNLAGHAYPSGGVRRSLELYVQVDDNPESLIATLADDAGGRTQTDKTQPALQPGETRSFPIPHSAGDVAARLVYIRNRFVEDSYQIEIQELNHSRPNRVSRPGE